MEMKKKFPPSPDNLFMTSPQFALIPPQVTKEYDLCSKLPNARLSTPRSMLLILDLNGTLLHRHNRNHSSANFARREKLAEFLDYCFNNFKVMVWTTAKPHNADLMCDKMLGPAQQQQVASVWARDKFNLTTQQYFEKTVVYKQLQWVWDDPNIQRHAPPGDTWNQTNTILLDDSTIKATAQPHNHIEVPEFTGQKSDANLKLKYGAVLEQVAGYLEEARYQSNVSAWMRDEKFVVDEKVGGDKIVGGWFRDLQLKDELDPTGELWPRNDRRDVFMMGYGEKMMHWG